MSARRQDLERRAARLWHTRRHAGALRPAAFAAEWRRPVAEPAPPPRVVAHSSVSPSRPSPGARTADRLDISVMFFSAVAGEAARPGLYGLVREAAIFADRAGFAGVWLPERHFHAFGGPYPNPAVLAASLASVTQRVRLRAGSVVLPLHHPVEVAEAWSMVDNLSGGRVELGFGSGWNPNDFVASPDTFADAKTIFRQRVDEVRTLWQGGALELTNGRGEAVSTRIYPRPVQSELPVWIAATGNPETFRWAGERGFNILTMLLGGSLDDLAPKIEAYRAAREAAGLPRDGGRVALMLHTFVHPDEDYVQATIREPFLSYVRSSVDAQRHGSDEGRAATPEQREQMVAYAFERYTRTAALFGAPETCRAMLERVAAAGVDEVAALVDFGVAEEAVLDALKHLEALRPKPVAPDGEAPPSALPNGPAVVAPALARPPAMSARLADEPVAIVGLAGRFPKCGDVFAFWDRLRRSEDLTGPPPAGRGGPGVPPRGGYLDDIEGFDAALFRIAPAEAEAMDPHQRLFLELVWAALEDGGFVPSALRGSDTGVFAAIYSHSHEAALRRRGAELDGVHVAGAVLSMVPNRTSFAFDWSGPSEAINTACSSGLVAVHRAVAALRAGECALAVAGGVSLLLAPEETAALNRLGILSRDGVCRAFDAAANGQVRGEGGGAVLLKRHADAVRDGDVIHALVRGTAVNHNGARGSSLTLPNSRRQAACMVDAVRRSGVEARRIGYIEAHGAGTGVGDLSELSAFGQAFAELGEGPAPGCRIGSVKTNIGALDAAGGLAGLIKAALAVREGWIPATLNRADDPDGYDPAGPFAFADGATSWPSPPEGARAAAVHAYGLGGTNAHVVLEGLPEDGASRAATVGTGVPDAPHRVAVSAQTPAALRATVARLAAWLEAAPKRPPLADIAHTLAVGRERFACRWSHLATDTDDLLAAMHGWLCGAAEADMGDEPAAPPPGGRRIAMPGTAFARAALAQNAEPAAHAATAGSADAPASVVGDFYDVVTRAEARHGDVFLTLAPLDAVVPGFSWTRTFQHPDRHPEHWAMIQAAQREMRDVLFSGVDMAGVRRVLDFGCGLGTDLAALARDHEHLSGVGYTISKRQASIANERVARAGLAGRVEIFNRDSAADPFPGPFDLAFGLEVAHHIADKNALFANLSAHLVEGGYLLLADCAANTVAPIELPDVGSFTSPKDDYGEILAAHGFEVCECVDLSQEIANFLTDPDLETMIAEESAHSGAGADLMAAVQRSWDGFGQGLRSGLVSYLLITARKRGAGADLADRNRQHLGGA